MKYQCREVSIMIGIIRQYLIGRTRIIDKRQLAQGAKKVAQSVKDRKLLKTKAKSQILAFIISISLIVPHSTFATGIVHDPQSFAQSYAQFVESIEKYNNMIKTAQDTLDTMNRINDVMNTANNTLNNLQTGLADPRQLYDRFEQNLKNIQANAERIRKSLEQRNWKDTFIKKEFASCKRKWQNLMKETKEYKEQQKKSQENKEYWEQEQASYMQSCTANGSTKEECEKGAETYQYAYEERQKEIDGELNTAEKAINQGAQTAINEINNVANAVQAKVDIFNLENKIKQVKNPYNYQKQICSKVDMERLNWDIFKYRQCYFEETAKGNQKEAKKCFRQWQQKENEKLRTKQDRMKAVYDNASGTFNLPIEEDGLLTVNKDTGALEPKEEWDKLFPEKVTLAETIPYNTPPDKDGNSQKKTVWVASSYTIHKLFYGLNRKRDALELQNQRNMAIAMQGDTQAVQRSQLETLQILANQITGLNKSINQLGNVANEWLQQQIDYINENQSQITQQGKKYIVDIDNEEKKYSKKFEKNLVEWGYGKFDDILEEDKNTGRIRFKNTKKDNSEISGL